MRDNRVEEAKEISFGMRWRSVVVSLILAATAFGLIACTSSSRMLSIRPRALNYASSADSLSLAAFDSLSSVEQRRRRAAAGVWRRRADSAQTAEERLRALRTIVGLTPDDAVSWVDLAELSRWFGWRREAGRYLLVAGQAEDRLPHEIGRDLRGRIAAALAWLDYDRGRWRHGKVLIDSASFLHGARREAMLVRGLLLAGAKRSWDATFLAQQIEEIRPASSDWRWVRSITDYYRDLPHECVQQFGTWADPIHRAEFWNDHGMAHERFELPDLARRSYENSFESLPLLPSITITKHEPAGNMAGQGKALPVWLVFESYYVTGSRPTCVEILYRNYRAADSVVAREFWADLVLEETEICFRHHLSRTRMRAIRGRVQLDLELYGLAENNLRRAIEETRRQGAVDAETLAHLGRLFLVGNRFTKALPLLVEAVELDAGNAVAWSNLGFARVMLNDLSGAQRALDRALELDPMLATAWYNRGLLYFNLQLWASAAEDFERAAVLNPENEAIIEILQRARLAQLREERGQSAGQKEPSTQ